MITANQVQGSNQSQAVRLPGGDPMGSEPCFASVQATEHGLPAAAVPAAATPPAAVHQGILPDNNVRDPPGQVLATWQPSEDGHPLLLTDLPEDFFCFGEDFFDFGDS